MKQEEFEKIVNEQIDYCKTLLFSKGEEYKIKDNDRLEYFKIASKVTKESAKQSLAGMMVKHTISIYSMCNDNKEYSIEKWTEKITDHINYLLLLKALIIEEGEKNEKY